jgi:hypothetical protein
MDWPTTVARFNKLFANVRTNEPTRLGGPNFVTDEVLGKIVSPGGSTVEVSTGMFLSQRVFGVTFPRLRDGSPDPRDQMCETLEEAHEVIFGEDAQVVENMMQAFNATDWSES